MQGSCYRLTAVVWPLHVHQLYYIMYGKLVLLFCFPISYLNHHIYLHTHFTLFHLPFTGLQASHTCNHILLSTSTLLNNSSPKHLKSTAQLKWCLWLPCIVFSTKGAAWQLPPCWWACTTDFCTLSHHNLSVKQQWLLHILKCYSRARMVPFVSQNKKYNYYFCYYILFLLQ